MARHQVLLSDFTRPDVVNELPDGNVEIDEARERLDASQARQLTKANEKRRKVISDAVEVIDELHRIVQEAAADDEISHSTTELVRTVAKRAVERAGERAEPATVSTESLLTPKERLLLSLESFNEGYGKLRQELEKLPQSDS